MGVVHKITYRNMSLKPIHIYPSSVRVGNLPILIKSKERQMSEINISLLEDKRSSQVDNKLNYHINSKLDCHFYCTMKK
jgi:hypothetical protein